jgi:hypothetical protein
MDCEIKCSVTKFHDSVLSKIHNFNTFKFSPESLKVTKLSYY